MFPSVQAPSSVGVGVGCVPVAPSDLVTNAIHTYVYIASRADAVANGKYSITAGTTAIMTWEFNFRLAFFSSVRFLCSGFDPPLSPSTARYTPSPEG